METLEEELSHPDSIYGRVKSIFEGIGYDFSKLDTDLYHPTIGSPDCFGDTLTYHTPDADCIKAFEAEVQLQIKEIETTRKLKFKDIERELIRTPLEEYANLLFLVLAAADKNNYRPKAPYRYKHPDEKQKILIQQMLDIYPFSDIWKIDEYKEWHLHREYDPSKQKAFTIKIGEYEIPVFDFDKQKHYFSLLAHEYKSQGLNQCYTYGEQYPPENGFTFKICERHLTKQKDGDRGGQNEKNFERDVIYRLHFLYHINEWYLSEVPVNTLLWDMMEDEVILKKIDIRQYGMSNKEAELIERLLRKYNIYKVKDGSNIANTVRNLMNCGAPDYNVVSSITSGHPMVCDCIDEMERRAYEAPNECYDDTSVD